MRRRSRKRGVWLLIGADSIGRDHVGYYAEARKAGKQGGLAKEYEGGVQVG